MAVRVRLTRVGSKKNPIWRVVVADGRSPRDGRTIETIGHYNPQTQPSRIEIDRERLQHWLDRGAQPSNTIRKLMRAENTGTQMPATQPPPVAVAATPAVAEADAEQAEAVVPDAEDPAAEAAAPAEPVDGDAGPGEEPPADVPATDVAADETEAPAEADENP